MSIFGDLDAETIPTNPNYIEKGDYEAEVTKAYFKDSPDKRQLVIEYTINHDGSEFDGKKAYHYFTLVDASMNKEMFALLPPDEKKDIQRLLATIKRTLCGDNGSANKRGLGVEANDLNDKNWNPEVIVGTKIHLGIGNWGTDGVNVRWVNLREE